MAKLFSGNNLVYFGMIVGFSALRHQQIRNAVIDSHSKFTKKYEGYKILACRQIQVYNAKDAYEKAYVLGKNSSNDLYDSLFGSYECFDKLDKEHVPTIKFAYNLILFGLSGQVAAKKLDLEMASKILKEIRINEEKNTDIDTSNWLSEKDINNIIKEYNK